MPINGAFFVKNALSIDVEDYFQVAAFEDNIERDSWDSIECRVERNTERFLALTEQRGIKATFFILGWIAERYPGLIKKIVAHGHEIACHGYGHQLIYKQIPATFRRETEYSKKLLEDISQQPVCGYRAASYSVTPESLWALNIIAELGFTYDSSIYPVKHDRYGLTGGPHQPYLIDLNNGAQLKEFPITTANLMGYRLPVGGGGYFRLFPFAVTRYCLQLRSRQTNAPFVFYLHPWELDPSQPRVQGASLISKFRHYNNLQKVEPRLLRLFDLFDFDTVQAVLDDVEYFPTHSYANSF